MRPSAAYVVTVRYPISISIRYHMLQLPDVRPVNGYGNHWQAGLTQPPRPQR